MKLPTASYGKIFLLIYLIASIIYSLTTPIATAPPPPPSVTFRVEPNITPGVAIDGMVTVDVYIDADPDSAVVGWGISIKVNPDVLKPGYEVMPGFEYWASSSAAGYYLYDWCITNGWDPEPGTSPTLFMAGSKDEVAGTITGTYEAIKLWAELGTGVGAEGTGKLATFYFTSKSETDYSPIEITEAYYYTSWTSPDLDKRVPDVITSGHYNNPVHDVAVTAVSAPANATVGDLVSISVDTSNPGAYDETFNLEVTYDSTVIGTSSVSLASQASKTKWFDWNTAGVTPGIYTINASAILPTDDVPANNWNTTIIEIMPAAAGGDVAVTSVVPAATEAYPTWTVTLNINVTVENVGATPATFTVTAYYDGNVIGTLTDIELASGATTELTFNWGLSAVPYGLYDIKAVATLADDVNPGNNELVVYDAVKVKLPGDVDGDGSVGGGDLGALGWAWGTTEGAPKYDQECDFDHDGSIGGGDLGTLGWNWGKSVTY